MFSSAGTTHTPSPVAAQSNSKSRFEKSSLSFGMVVRFNHSGEEDKWEGEWIAVGDHSGVLWFPSALGR